MIIRYRGNESHPTCQLQKCKHTLGKSRNLIWDSTLNKFVIIRRMNLTAAEITSNFKVIQENCGG